MKMKDVSVGHFSQSVFLILSCLENGPTHIVALKQTIDQHSDDDLEPGTLYGVLVRLEQRGWIVALHDRDSLYQLTASGKEAIENHRIAIHEQRERIGVLARNTFFKARTTKERTMKLLTWIIKLYPQAWRVRYETEMLAVLEAHTVTLWTLFDLLFGALDARLDPYYRTEKTLFSFKNVQTATIAFIIMLAIALFCKMIWDTQSDPLGCCITGDDTVWWFPPLMLFASNVLTAIVAVKRAIIARHLRLGTALLAVICFIAIPFILLLPCVRLLIILPFVMLNKTGNGALFWYSFYVFAGLELLMGCLFLIIIKGITAIATRKKGPLLVCAFVAILLVLIEYWFYVSKSVFPTDFTNSMSGLLPFAGTGALLLVATNIKMNRRNLRMALIIACLLVLGMIVDLKFTIEWTISSWGAMMHILGPWFFFDGRYPLIATIVLVITTLLALVALIYGFSSVNTLRNTDVENEQVEKNVQVIPQQVQ